MYSSVGESAQYKLAYAPDSAESSLSDVQGNIQKVENNKNINSAVVISGIILIYFLLIHLMLPMFLVFFTAILGILALLFGFRYFSRHMITANTPVSKIFAAPIGFGIFNVQFVPENNQPLISPLTKTPCVFYSVTLNTTSNSRYGSYTTIISYTKKGTPSILTDGTGYIVTNLSNSFDCVEGLYKIYSLHVGVFDLLKHQFSIPEEISPLKEAIDNANNNTNIDLTSTISSLKTAATEQKIGKPPQTPPEGYTLIEYVIPTNTDYTAIGFLNHTEKTFNNKPVSKLVKDPQTQILDLRYGAENRVSKKYDKIAYSMFAVGMIALIMAYLGGSYHNFYECLIITNNSDVLSCHYINGTNVVLYKPEYHVIKPVTINVPYNNTIYNNIYTNEIANVPNRTTDCGNFYVSDYNYSDTKYYTCTWSGGNITISLQGGDSGHIGVKITSLTNGTVYYAKNSPVRCLTPMANIYLPAGPYQIYFNTGAGGGYCGPDILEMNAT